jgi:hypothetical protein
MPGKSLTPAEMREIHRLAREGELPDAIAAMLGRHVDTIRDHLKKIHLDPKAFRLTVEDLPGPIPYEELSPAAKRALADIEYFSLIFFGHILRPWQVLAANEIVEALESDEEVYLVYNAPSGAGKSSDKVRFAAWITARNRAIRGCFGSDVATNAERDLKRLRRHLERTTPAKASGFALKHGFAVDATHCLAIEYGRFKPLRQETWRDDAFVVEQLDPDDSVVEKEPTWSSYGRDSGVLGNRFDFIDWDDLVTKTNIRSEASVLQLQEDWDSELESRLEPGGVHVLRGQRMAARDLYRHCLDKMTEELGEDDEGNEVVVTSRPQYRHICYKAHDPTRCLDGAKGSHRRDARPWPEGCLLEPARIPWTKCRTMMLTKPKVFALMYQQEDVNPDDVLVSPSWIDGTEDEDGIHPGCLDHDRRLRTLPPGIRGPLVSCVTVDPSASKMWAVEWWIYAPTSGLRFLFDLVNNPMPAPDLLDWSNDTQEHRGILQEWMEDSFDLGVPITHLVVEENACQKWLFQFEHFRTWQRRWPALSVLPHATGHRKLDKALGVPLLGPLYRAGMVRLPWHRSAQPLVKRFVDQITRWSEEVARSGGKQTEDMVMANWFLEVKLPQIAPEVRHMEPVYLHRPSWMVGRTGRPHEDAWATVESPYEAELRARRGA